MSLSSITLNLLSSVVADGGRFSWPNASLPAPNQSLHVVVLYAAAKETRTGRPPHVFLNGRLQAPPIPCPTSRSVRNPWLPLPRSRSRSEHVSQGRPRAPHPTTHTIPTSTFCPRYWSIIWLASIRIAPLRPISSSCAGTSYM